MFQSFESRSARGQSTARLTALRARMRREDLAGYLVPHADEYQSENLPASAERLAWLTGFTGSAGDAVILINEAAIFVDGRYQIQAAKEVDEELFTIVDIGATPPSKWMGSRLKSADRVGYDPMLLSAPNARRLAERCEAAGAKLVAVETNLIDEMWSDRPEPSTAPVHLHPVELAGKSSQEKLAEIVPILKERKVNAALITAPDSVAWAFNIRGRDVAHNPAPLARALIKADGKPTLYIDGRKLSNAVRDNLSDLVDVAEPSRLVGDLEALAKSGARLLIDGETAAARYVEVVSGAGGSLEESTDPISPLKSRKNDVQLEGARRAHLRDGVAMVRFLAWIDQEALRGNLDEIACVKALEQFRADTALEDGAELKEISFDTISGAGPNGAIVHYRVTEDSNRKLVQDSLLLVDSGGQYVDGTTDISRTIAIGTPTEEMRTRFSLVLKGHIAVADARFPAGTNGVALDAFARQALWRAGLDYDHGTGHGVGSYLSVHEGPPRISKRGGVALEAGMIISNEPGFYKAGAYGIRIENLVVVLEADLAGSGDRPMHSFETLTLCPIDRRLIDSSLLTSSEREWVNAYHARVLRLVSSKLGADDRDWLERATAPI